jgi:hypothetical protein
MTIAATDGSVKTVKRSRVIPLKSNEMNSLKQAKNNTENITVISG